MTVLLVGAVAWIGSYDLDPAKPIAHPRKPVKVQVVSLDWKWLFIYPEQGVASVNHLTIPVGTPVSFELTSSGVMNSFFVPQLGSQIYTMAGMVTRLNLRADHPGTYRGMSAIFSGEGFSDMRFKVDAVTDDSFAQWVASTRERRSGARRTGLCRSGQAEQGGRAIHLSLDRPRSVCQHPECRDATGRRALCHLSQIHEGRTMNLLGKLDWNAIPLHEPIIMGTAAWSSVVVAVLAWVT